MPTTPVVPEARTSSGHTAGELRRLAIQASLIDPITRRFVGEGGITEGMRVLDIGSGGGHVAFLVADLVGAAGRVVGVDRSPTAVDAARAGARARSLGNVEFQAGDPAEMVFDQPFDAVVGRYVLQFQVDPVSVLRSVVRHVRPGGSVVFHELDWGGIWSFPPAALHDRCCAWAMETIRRSGAETNMGLKLHSTFVAAGLAEPEMRMEAVIAGGAQAETALERGGRPGARRWHRRCSAWAWPPRRRSTRTHCWTGCSNEVRTTNSVVLGRLQVGCWARR